MSLTKATYSMIDGAPVNVLDFGAVGDGVADDTAAIQAAIDYAHGLSTGGLVYFNGTFKITSTLTIGGRVHLTGPAVISQATNNTPIIKVNKDTFNANWSITNLNLEYATQQTSANTNARALVLSEANKLSYLFNVDNVNISKAYRGIDAPNEVGSFAFLATFNNVNITQCADWGFNWENATVGGTTFLTMNNVWVNNIDGQEISTSKGFRIFRCFPITIDSIAVDHIQNTPVEFQTCRGTVTSVAVEQCDLSGSSGAVPVVLVSNSTIDFGTVVSTSNTITISGSASGALIRVSDAARVTVASLVDLDNTVIDTSSDLFYTISPADTSQIEVQKYGYVAAVSNPAPNGSDSDFSQPYKLRFFNNNVRTDTRGGKTYIFDTAAPTSGTWVQGDTVTNTSPTAGGFIGWVCVTGGTPGTWKTFGAISV